MTTWPDPWYAPPENQMRGLESQLSREVGKGHCLEGLHVRLIARRDGSDDALFALDDGRVAQVHMTWRQSSETDPTFPWTTIFANLEAWLQSAPED